MADFLTDTRAEIERRLEELRPLQEEYNLLERAKAALDGLDGQSAPSGRARRPSSGGASGRTAARSGRRAAPANGRRRRRAGGRSGETLELVRQNPGITVAEIADRLGMKQRNYLYRILADLQSQGAVEKEGRGFFAR
ncbi:MAG TPA: winged helix-turn-helix transcriptional regulator [Thermoleophilaceae bacterium]|nr:winged helix-turn-helix transcriptional regulator [Thermoleophilaceae bacterium]